MISIRVVVWIIIVMYPSCIRSAALSSLLPRQAPSDAGEGKEEASSPSTHSDLCFICQMYCTPENPDIAPPCLGCKHSVCKSCFSSAFWQGELTQDSGSDDMQCRLCRRTYEPDEIKELVKTPDLLPNMYKHARAMRLARNNSVAIDIAPVVIDEEAVGREHPSCASVMLRSVFRGAGSGLLACLVAQRSQLESDAPIDIVQAAVASAFGAATDLAITVWHLAICSEM